MENSTNSQTNDFPSVPLDGSFQAVSEATSRSNRNEEQRQEKAKTSAEISIMAQAEWNALRVAANDQNHLSLKKKKVGCLRFGYSIIVHHMSGTVFAS